MSFETMDLISYPRYTASDGANKACHTIFDEIKKLGLFPKIDEFDFETYEVSEVKLKIHDTGEEIKAKCYGLSGTGEFIAKSIYIADGADLSLYDIKGKIVLMNSRMCYDLYKELNLRGALGFICGSGSIYDSSFDIEDRSLKLRHLNNGTIPGMSIHMRDLEKLIALGEPVLSFKLSQKNVIKKALNIYTKIEGKIEEEVVFSAHLDSYTIGVGAFDNALGVGALLDLMAYYKENPPYRTIEFVILTGENQELLGSKHYLEVINHENILFNINIDLLGPYLGYDVSTATGDISICNYVDYLAKKLGYAVKTKQGVFYSSGLRFAQKNIPTVSFARFSAQGGVQYYSKMDDRAFLSKESYLKSLSFIKEFSNHMINSMHFPIPRFIPDTLLQKLDEFFGYEE